MLRPTEEETDRLFRASALGAGEVIASDEVDKNGNPLFVLRWRDGGAGNGRAAFSNRLLRNIWAEKLRNKTRKP